jgi:CRISPR/Cas system CSM-associated protein Csm3 (group 7 of RAMP superfamily)
MSRESQLEAEAIRVFQLAVARNVFTTEELRAMLIKASTVMNSYEIKRMVAITPKESLDNLRNIVNP